MGLVWGGSIELNMLEIWSYPNTNIVDPHLSDRASGFPSNSLLLTVWETWNGAGVGREH